MVLVALSTTLVACSCQQRIERLQRTCPECFERVVVTDTVVLPPTSTDTVAFLHDLEQGERVELHLDQMTLTLALEGDTLLLHAERPPDTVVVAVPVKVPQPSPNKDQDIPVGALLFLALFVALILINLKTSKQSKP